ncbi:Ig-like domain-containing protein [Streptomyces sp. S.PNR 29]|uniref:Ig-like domain-containing protein n=1 Tax=Streptomyces sp. S.PNR 29 TaxID=2973805 RepID=UPI0025B04A95|nr:Ig-like domain-containing protein [Streptomyces sp. S.PNR 29]MDN0200475.1 Ig-like domain-containing protein [Streptomyces sp. S.PNR 29]
MSRSRKTATAVRAAMGWTAVAGFTLASPGPAAVADSRDARDSRALRAPAVTIVPGGEGILAVAGYTGPRLGAGSVLTLTAPGGSTVTGTPLGAREYRGAVAADGGSGTYTFTGPSAGRPWQGRGFPFVLAVPADAVPGTRLPGCALRLSDAEGRRQARGTCSVTVGMPGPTLTRPESGVPLHARPEISGTAYPGARITVRDKDDRTVCTTTAAADGTWTCTPRPAFPAGANRLQATAGLNGVSATSEQIRITVRPRTVGAPDRRRQ